MPVFQGPPLSPLVGFITMRMEMKSVSETWMCELPDVAVSLRRSNCSPNVHVERL